MNRSTPVVWVLGLIAGLACLPTVSAQQEKFRHAETIRLVDVVSDAAALVRQKGEAAFPELMEKGSRWRSGDLYIFVIDLKGMCYVHEDRSLVGKNLGELKDPSGKPFIQWFIRKALGPTQSGWTHYRWVKPGDTLPQWKTTYTKLANTPSGAVFIVGAGLYNMRMERAFAVEAVDDAVVLIRQMGPRAFPILKDKTSEFVYKDTYIFVVDSAFVVQVDPPFPGEEGRNVRDYQDVNGKYFFREFFRVASEKGTGWVDYSWPKPGETIPSAKSTYIRKIVVRGIPYLVGTGIYRD
ncbi:MAG TPA: cache domain-containing protein [Bacteroidales bacterium]|nr:cache domain-containing protein [Bacteroidales bacterium]HPS62038.1 cache domain-containing protein [Bacteroidales bacterium]